MPKYRLYRIEQGTYVHFSKRDFRRLCACYGTTSLEVLSIFPDDLFEDRSTKSKDMMNYQPTSNKPGDCPPRTDAASPESQVPSPQLSRLGHFLAMRSVNKAVVARRTGLSKQRMGEITLNQEARLRANEVYLIALAIGVNPGELFEHVCAGLTLKN